MKWPKKFDPDRSVTLTREGYCDALRSACETLVEKLKASVGEKQYAESYTVRQLTAARLRFDSMIRLLEAPGLIDEAGKLALLDSVGLILSTLEGSSHGLGLLVRNAVEAEGMKKQSQRARGGREQKDNQRMTRLHNAIVEEAKAQDRELKNGIKFSGQIRKGVRKRLGENDPEAKGYPEASAIRKAITRIRNNREKVTTRSGRLDD